jgi:hypothetical protein
MLVMTMLMVSTWAAIAYSRYASGAESVTVSPVSVWVLILLVFSVYLSIYSTLLAKKLGSELASKQSEENMRAFHGVPNRY